ncbi:hypothetical protein J437_LFUL007075 [Ladona fulva]|uniref:USP domain-containing protein n=1 Tax=Ladona fulva TaxID=123851 RepID=A0A8K0NY44_LADFU|nr:hypothetical protein J437_LFUL007075 [Ladona fulva]
MSYRTKMTVFSNERLSGSSVGPPKKKSCLSLARNSSSEKPFRRENISFPPSSSEEIFGCETPSPSKRSWVLQDFADQSTDQEMTSSSRPETSLTTLTAASGYLFPPYAAHSSNGRINPYHVGLETDHGGSRNSASDNAEFGVAAALCNLGNTCFLNSVLYTLRFAPCFLHNLHHLVMDVQKIYGKEGNGSLSRSTVRENMMDGSQTSRKFEKSKVQVVTEKLHELYISLHTAEKKESNEPFQPDSFLHALRDVNPIFEGNQQHDAHELLMCLLNNIRDTCQQLATAQAEFQGPSLELELPGSSSSSSTTSSSSSHGAWKMHKSWKRKKNKSSGISISLKGKKKYEEKAVDEVPSNPSVGLDANCDQSTYSSDTKEKVSPVHNPSVLNFISGDFEGVTLLRTKCLECEHVTEQRETFCDICVPITADYTSESGELPIRPNDIFRSAILASENLRDLNKYWCEQCLSYNEACRTVRYESLPRLLILQLKRFSAQPSEHVGSHLGSRIWPMTCMYKVKNYMPTPLTLDCFCETCRLSETGTPPHSYRLYGVIMHIGSTIASGHYVSYVRVSQSEYDYYQCDHDQCTGTEGSGGVLNCGKRIGGSGSTNTGGLFKFFKPKQADFTRHSGQGNMCRSINCCSMKINRAALAAFSRGYGPFTHSPNTSSYGHTNENRTGLRQTHAKEPSPSVVDASVPEDPWLVCDDETIQPLTRKEFEEILAPRASTVTALTPYLLFYAKCP